MLRTSQSVINNLCSAFLLLLMMLPLPESIPALCYCRRPAGVCSARVALQLISINTEDPLAPLLNDLDDLEVHLPGTVESLHRWLRLYKSKDGIINEFGFEGKAQGRKFSEELIEETHEDWRALVEARGGKATVSKE